MAEFAALKVRLGSSRRGTRPPSQPNRVATVPGYSRGGPLARSPRSRGRSGGAAAWRRQGRWRRTPEVAPRGPRCGRRSRCRRSGSRRGLKSWPLVTFITGGIIAIGVAQSSMWRMPRRHPSDNNSVQPPTRLQARSAWLGGSPVSIIAGRVVEIRPLPGSGGSGPARSRRGGVRSGWEPSGEGRPRWDSSESDLTGRDNDLTPAAGVAGMGPPRGPRSG